MPFGAFGFGLGFSPSRPRRPAAVVAWTPADDIGGATAPYWWQQAGAGDLTDPDDTNPALTRVNAAVDRVGPLSTPPAAGFQCTQSVEANKPLRETVSGLPAYAFVTANSQRLNSTGVPTGTPVGAAPRIMIALLNQTISAANNTPNNTRVFLGYGGGNTGQFRIGRFSNGGRNRVVISDGTNSVIDNAADDTRNFDGVTIVVATYDGTNIGQQVNGRAGLSGALALNTTNERIRIGCNPATTAAQFAEGHFFEAAIIPWIADPVVRAAKIAQWEGYLAWRAGVQSKLPTSHPYYAARPTRILPPVNLSAPATTGTALMGGTLTCSSGIWTEAPTFSYQWSRDGRAIAGAAASTYTLQEIDQGTAITCTVIATGARGAASATASAGTITPTYWTPLEPAATGEVRAWFDPRYSGGAGFAYDRVGGVTPVQTDPTLQPAFSATGMLGSYPAYLPDGVDDFLEAAPVPTAGAHGWPVGTAAGWMCVLVDQQVPISTPGTQTVFGYGSSAAYRKFGRAVGSGGGATNRAFISDGGVVEVDFSGFDGPTVLFGIFEPTQKRLRLNGVDGDVHPSTLASTPTTRARIGKPPDTASQFFASPIAHCFVGAGTPSLDLIQRLEAWLLWQIGQQSLLPIGHPWRTNRPTPVVLGDSVMHDTDGAFLIDTDGARLLENLTA